MKCPCIVFLRLTNDNGLSQQFACMSAFDSDEIFDMVKTLSRESYVIFFQPHDMLLQHACACGDIQHVSCMSTDVSRSELQQGVKLIKRRHVVGLCTARDIYT